MGSILGHVGDSRFYQMTENDLQQVSQDHSPVGTLLRAKIINEAEALKHPKKHLLSQALGAKKHCSAPRCSSN